MENHQEVLFECGYNHPNLHQSAHDLNSSPLNLSLIDLLTGDFHSDFLGEVDGWILAQECDFEVSGASVDF